MDDSQKAAAALDKSLKESLEARERLYHDRESADLELVCGTKVFKVHSFVIKSWFRYFEVAFFGNFKEAREKRINLPEDDPFLIARVIQFMYAFDYPEDKITAEQEWRKVDESGLEHRYQALIASADEIGTEEGWVSRVNTNVKMYNLADKFGFLVIKQVAQTRLGIDIDWAREHFSLVEFQLLKEIPLIYESTLDTDRGMRDLMLDYVAKDWVRLSLMDELLDAFAQAPVFAMEMVTAMNPTTMYKGTCRRCHTNRPRWTAERVRCICGCSETVTGGDDPPKRPQNIIW